MSTPGDQAPIAWTALDPGAAVLAADGSEVGRVKELAGDENADIFDGLVVVQSEHGTSHYVASERVKGIWPDRVETDLSPEEAASLPAYEEPEVTTWRADEGGGFGARLKRATKDLFGRR